MKSEQNEYYQSLVANYAYMLKVWVECICRLQFQNSDKVDEELCQIMNEIRRLERGGR